MKNMIMKLFIVLLALFFVTGENVVNDAHARPIIKNQTEDLDILISQFVGGNPNVLMLFDMSLEMGVNFGGAQIGKWDTVDAFDLCTELHSGDDNTSRAFVAHCTENISNLNVCGSKHCKSSDALCRTPEEFDSFLDCIKDKSGFTNADIDSLVTINSACGAADVASCDTPDKRAHAASGIEMEVQSKLAITGLVLSHCQIIDNAVGGNCSLPFCGTVDDLLKFESCARDQSTLITVNKAENCTADAPDCDGAMVNSSQRSDALKNVFFNILDADGGLADAACADPSLLYDGVHNRITCQQWMETPFRDVSSKVLGTGGGPAVKGLPVLVPPDPSIPIDLTDTGPLTTETVDFRLLTSFFNQPDAEILGARIRPMSFSGEGSWGGCSANTTFNIPQGGFAGSSKLDFEAHWKFLRAQQPFGGSPLAFAIGLDDSNASNSFIGDDVLNAYKVELQTDPAVGCRPEFVIIITGGEDNCAGDCSATATPGQCDGLTTTNANRRSMVQAVSNLRTYYARNPAPNGNLTVAKEVLVFVIGVGVNDDQTFRTLNAMALAGGTHTTGIIEHTNPSGQLVGLVKIDAAIPNKTTLQVYKDLGIVKDFDTSASGAQLQGCGSTLAERIETGGSCTFQGTELFDDAFFDNGAPFKPEQTRGIQDFAYIASNPKEIADAIRDILQIVRGFSTSGASPAAPQSSTSVALRDRIFLSLLTPVTFSKIWQGRLALYGFVGVGNSRFIVSKKVGTVEERSIFSSTGSLGPEAANYYWEAGKKLAERDITDPAHQRRLFTYIFNKGVDLDVAGADPYDLATDTSTIIEDDGAGNLVGIRVYDPDISIVHQFSEISKVGGVTTVDTDLHYKHFDISNSDITSVNTEEICEEACPVELTTDICTAPFTDDCILCIKNCLRDEIVGFMSGVTDIFPITDPMGLLAEQASCPTLDEIRAGTGDLTTCSVRLGDVFHSTPRVVGSPSPLFFDTGFQSFAKGFRERTSAVYVGANDGFFHAFMAGNFCNPNLENLNDNNDTCIVRSVDGENRLINPFTEEVENLSYFDDGGCKADPAGCVGGTELFAWTAPSYFPATRSVQRIGSNPPPDYRLGDFKQFVLGNTPTERSWYDGSPLIADIWIDGNFNGLTTDKLADIGVTCSTSDNPQVDGVIDICGKEWHTVAVTTMKNGGGVITALDVTNIDITNAGNNIFDKYKKYTTTNAPDYPEHLWTMFDVNFGNLWGDPLIGRVKLLTSNAGDSVIVDRWVIFLGGGIHPTVVDPLLVKDYSLGNAFYVIDMATGQIIWKFAHTASAANTDVADERMLCDMPASVGAFDVNSDGYTDLIYAGDRCGRLWRFDVSEPLEDNGSIDSGVDPYAPNWTGDITFCANSEDNCDPDNNYFPDSPTKGAVSPIFFPPTAVLDDLARRHVIFLTGNRREPSNVDDHGVLVSYIDEYVPSAFGGGTAITPKNFDDFGAGLILDLGIQTGDGVDADDEQFTNTATSLDGEFLVIFPDNKGPQPESQNQGGEKGFGSPVVVNRVLIWTTFSPNVDQTDPCSEVSGFGRIFAIDYLTGEPALSRIPGTAGLLAGDDTGISLASGKTVATGLPTPAQLSFGARGSVVLVVAFSGSSSTGSSQFLIWDLPPFPSRTQTLFWEEIF